MDEVRFNKSYLESLTTDELIKLADRFAIDIPPELERIFIIEELVDLAADDDFGREKDDEPLRETDFFESVPLPKQYNITFIEAIPRDPLWVFIFWEIKSHDQGFYEEAADFGGYHLKVCPLDGLDKLKADSSFTVSIGTADTAWYLDFPPSGGRFRVELCAVRKNEEIVLAASHPFRMPRLLSPPKIAERAKTTEEWAVYQNPLSCLSGAKDFPVLRSGDRISRTMRPCVL
ncbi:MAG: DUF4912 domain-containing protein [Treponema sp.]|jgi:hypothetical protein|nr:DUF4912 domain-containing protein [Treponema sp.]